MIFSSNARTRAVKIGVLPLKLWSSPYPRDNITHALPMAYLFSCFLCPHNALEFSRIQEHYADTKNKKKDTPWGEHVICYHGDMDLTKGKTPIFTARVLAFEENTVQSLPKVKSLPHFFCMIQWVDCSNFSQVERLCTKILYSFCRTKKFGLQRLKELL